MARLKNTDASVWAGSPLTRKKTSFSLITGIVFGIIFLTLVTTIITFALLPSQNTPADTSSKQDGFIFSGNTDQTTNPDSTYTVSMNNDWYFDDGTSPSSNAYVENAAENSLTIYFEIILSNTNQTVYSSPYIPVGSTLEHPALSVVLDAGDYDSICLYHLVDNSNNELSTVSAEVTLHILN